MNILERIVLWIAQTTSSEVAQLDEARELANDAAGEIEALTARLAAAEARLRRYEPEPDICEHGVTEGDWCEPCNQTYKEAANGGGHE